MDPQLTASLQQLGNEINDLAAKVARLERGQRANNLNNAAIDGSALLVKDTTGTVRQVIGAQSDGTVTIVEQNAPAGPVPSDPLVAPTVLGLTISWDGTFAGGVAQPSDFDHIEVHISATSGFTPSSGTLAATMIKAGTFSAVPLATVAQYVVLVAVNRSGMASAPSDQETATPALIGSGSVSFNANGATVTIAPAAPSSPLLNDIWFDTSNEYRMNQWNGTTWSFYQFGTNAIADGAVTAAQIAADTITAAQIAAGTITAALIAADTITATQIAAGTITAAQIAANTITAAEVAAGVVDGQTITGSTIRNSATNPKTSINPDGSITITNSSGVTVFKIAPDGTTNWYQSNGELLQTIEPDGTQLVYQSLTGPTNWSFEDGTIQGWAGVAATPTVATDWASDGMNSLKVTATGTTTSPWGTVSPAFTVQAGATASAKLDIFTPSVLSALEIVMTFWSGAGGGGTNLGTAAGDAGTIATTAGEIATLTLTGATVPAGAVSATVSVLEAANATSGQYFEIDNIAIPGGLVYSNSPTGGTDQFGNVYQQGEQFYGLPGQTNTFGVEDPYNNQLAAIDSSGNASFQTVNAAQDLLVGGNSLLTSLLPSYALGLVTRGYTNSLFTSWPTGNIGASELAMMELDATLTAGRAYRIKFLPTLWYTNTAAAGARFTCRIRYTTDGSVPTTSSAFLAAGAGDMPVSSTTIAQPFPGIEEVIVPGATANYRFLLTATVGSGTAKFYNELEMTVEDLGAAAGGEGNQSAIILGSGTSGGTAPVTYTTSWYPTQTYSYYGSGASKGSNGRRQVGGTMWQGSPGGATGPEVGDQYSFILWPYAAIQAALAGATINSVKLRLTNQASHYSGGTYAVLGYANFTSFGATGSLTGAHEDVTDYFVNEGGTLNQDITGFGFGNNLKSGACTCFILGPSSSTPGGSGDLYNYGLFAGASSGTSIEPMLTINYTT